MSSFKLLIFIVLAFILSHYKIFAQELVTDRPDQTESSVTVPIRSLQIEGGLSFASLKENSINIKETLLPTVLFRYGLSKGIELRLVAQNEKLKNDTLKIHGLSDLEIGTKIQLLKKENIKTEIAFLAHVIVPTGKKELTNGKAGVVSKLAFSYPASNVVETGCNIGYSNFGFDDGSLTYSLVTGFSITDKISAYIEPFGEYFNFRNFYINADTGITYLLRENFQLDISFGTGLNYKMNYLAFGFSWRIPQ